MELTNGTCIKFKLRRDVDPEIMRSIFSLRENCFHHPTLKAIYNDSEYPETGFIGRIVTVGSEALVIEMQCPTDSVQAVVIPLVEFEAWWEITTDDLRRMWERATASRRLRREEQLRLMKEQDAAHDAIRPHIITSIREQFERFEQRKKRVFSKHLFQPRCHLCDSELTDYTSLDAKYVSFRCSNRSCGCNSFDLAVTFLADDPITQWMLQHKAAEERRRK